ncbi:hypothetical protein [Pontibacter toksunensis]|uniref:hypothetical protein n=1 Tax=Pontibacter toksunensis TaxID=1332631 RepID=UPI00366C943B
MYNCIMAKAVINTPESGGGEETCSGSSFMTRRMCQAAVIPCGYYLTTPELSYSQKGGSTTMDASPL